MGTPEFAVKPLDAISGSDHEIGYVVCQPDKASGRGKKVNMPAVKAKALELGLKVLQPENIRIDEEVIKNLKEYDADVFVVAAYGQILSKEVLEMPRYGCINIHGSILPRHRGAAPMQRAIEDGDERTGITLMAMDEGLDTGDIIEIKDFEIGDMNLEELSDKMSNLGGEMIVGLLDRLGREDIPRRKQDDSKSTYAAMITKEEGRIDFSMDAQKVERKIRAFNPWPSAYTTFRGETLKIYKAEVVTQEDLKKLLGENLGTYQPGEVSFVSKKKLVVACSRDFLSLKEVQLMGKKRLEIPQFLAGARIKAGEILGKST